MTQDIEGAYESLEGDEDVMAYDRRHDIQSAGILTISDAAKARQVAESLRTRIAGKVVVEIGAGVGLLAIEMGRYAERVYAIEADPAWSWIFVRHLFRAKPANVSWLFGSAEQFGGMIRADVAIFATRSGRESMRQAAELFTDPANVIDLWGFVEGTT